MNNRRTLFNLENEYLRYIIIVCGAILFLYAVGAFLIRLIIALAGLFFILLGLTNHHSFSALRRRYYRK